MARAATNATATRLDRVRALMRSGAIPARKPDCTLARVGSGQEQCPVCEDSMLPTQVVWEAEFSGPGGTSRYACHDFCFRLIELHGRLYPSRLHPSPRVCRSDGESPGGSVTDDPTLREKARALLQSGQFEARSGVSVLAGRASGQERCCVCLELVMAGQVFWEAESRPGGTSLFFHVSCFHAVESQSQSVEDAPVSEPGRLRKSG